MTLIDDELYLEIDDDYKSVDFFDVEQDYKNYHSDKRLNEIRISVMSAEEAVAYLECFLFFDKEIKESGESLVTVADEELADDSYEAMGILEKQGVFDRDDSSHPFYLLAEKNISTVYIHHIAVKEDYRCKGIGGWLLRNLRDILEINYAAAPGAAIVKLCPERIVWGSKVPDFIDDLAEDAEYQKMFSVMQKLFERNGFTRHEASLFFIRDYASE